MQKGGGGFHTLPPSTYPSLQQGRDNTKGGGAQLLLPSERNAPSILHTLGPGPARRTLTRHCWYPFACYAHSEIRRTGYMIEFASRWPPREPEATSPSQRPNCVLDLQKLRS